MEDNKWKRQGSGTWATHHQKYVMYQRKRCDSKHYNQINLADSVGKNGHELVASWYNPQNKVQASDSDSGWEMTNQTYP